MTFKGIKVNMETERERAQNEIDDAIEAISVLDNAIACGFLKDKHSLIAQEWIKEYKNDIENCKIFLDNNKDVK
tara:strand:+ start:68 stop:289 length:222 start_codon:yes stop_codon:yes gene_type:complete